MIWLSNTRALGTKEKSTKKELLRDPEPDPDPEEWMEVTVWVISA